MSRRKRKKKLAQIIPDLLNVYRYFKQDIQKKSGLIAGSFCALFVGVIFRLLEPWPLKFVLDQVFSKQSTDAAESLTLPLSWSTNTVILIVAISVIAIAMMRAAMDYVARVGFFKVGNYVVIKVRDRVFRHLQALPMSFHDNARHGDLITRVTRDVSLLRDVSATAMLPLLGSSMVLFGMATVMLWLNWKLALLSLVIIPLYWLTTVRLGRQIRETARKQRQRESAMATIASEAVGSIRSVKALGLQQKFADDFDQKNNQSQTDDLKASRLSLRLGRTVDILLAIATACVLWLGAHYVLEGKMFPGDLVVFLVYLKRSFKPAQEFAKYTARIAKATAAGERVIKLLEQPLEKDTGDKEVTNANSRIQFENVSFAYDREQLVLKDFNLTIEPGKTVAVTGSSGTGKSTLLALMMRLYKPTSGRIILDGIDISEYKLESLRSTFTTVLQNPLLFAGSIRDNIAIGNQNGLPDEDVIKAGRLAEVDEFALQMPNQYNSHIGERGNTLSRGQRQRIAIARAALSSNPILLLDEPTTGLDETNQAIVGDALIHLGRNRTTVVVTHNLNLASKSDEIVFVEDGQVKQQGTHEQLLQSDGPYRRMFEQQVAKGENAERNSHSC